MSVFSHKYENCSVFDIFPKYVYQCVVIFDNLEIRLSRRIYTYLRFMYAKSYN